MVDPNTPAMLILESDGQTRSWMGKWSTLEKERNGLPMVKRSYAQYPNNFCRPMCIVRLKELKV